MSNAKRVIIGVVISVLVIILGLLAGCNRSVIDVTYRFDKAIIKLPDGSIVQGEVVSWRDYDDGDQIQVNIDGTTYLTHSVNVVLINSEE